MTPTPLPVRLLQFIALRVKYPVHVIGIGSFLLLLGFFHATDVLSPQFVEHRINVMESTGLALLMSALPAYLFMCLLAQIRSAPVLKANLVELLDSQHQYLADQLDSGRFWWIAKLVGVIFAITSNINWMSITFQPADERFWWSIGNVTGLMFMWGTIGIMLYMKLHNSFLLYRIGRLVHVDIFNTERLNCFGRVAINDLLIVVGAMALTPLQSIDQVFRWINYENAILVGVPSALLLLLLPIWSVHRRILQAKREEYALINAAIDQLPKSLEPQAVVNLNSLLDRRNFVQHLRSWPMDLSLFSRFLFYVLIPPLAWVGAALMEFLVDSYLQ